MGESEDNYIGRLCYYACLNVFDDYYDKLNDDYADNIIAGSKRNLEFAKKVWN